MNMRESDCQRELSRSTKLPEEVYRIELSYQRGERASKSYTAKPASSAPPITIKQEPVKNIRRGQEFFRGRARGRHGGYTQKSSSGGSGYNRRCCNCDAPKFTLDHIASCPAKGATCNSCRKLGHFERTCRGIRRGTNQWRGQGRVRLVGDENEHHQSIQSVNDVTEDPVALVNQQGSGENEYMKSGSDDYYMMMSIKRKKNVTELKIPGARVQVEVSGKKMWLWIDSGSPMTMFSMTDLKTTLGKANTQLQPSKDEFLDYNNNQIHILGKMGIVI